MLKSLAVAVAALFVVTGCVTVGPTPSSGPSGAATAAPSVGVPTPAPVTQAPTVAPTVAPTLPPTLAPTLPPVITPAPTEGATLPPTTEPSGTPGATGEPTTRDLLYNDDMSDPTSGWEELNQDFATVSYDSGVLAMRFNENPAWAFTVRQLTAANTTLVETGDFAPQSAGLFGLLCGDSATDSYYGAVVTTDGGLDFIETDNSTINVLERHDNLGLNVSIGSSNLMALECSLNVDGAVQMVVGLANTGPVAVYRHAGNGISSFDVSGLYGEAASDNYTLAVDTAAAWAAGGADGTMSDGAQILFAHIPTDLQQNCYESPIWNTDATYSVSCVLQTQGKGGELLQFKQYADANGMNAAYQDLVTAFGVESQGSCQSGPNEGSWTVNEQTGGRVQCAPQFVGIRFDWTDDLTNILSLLIDFDGSYPDTYGQWQDAGPITPAGLTAFIVLYSRGPRSEAASDRRVPREPPLERHLRDLA